MKLLFTCPNSERDFHSAQFELINNKGIVTDPQGNRSLDADIIVRECPICGKSHTYPVATLSCPWSPDN